MTPAATAQRLQTDPVITCHPGVWLIKISFVATTVAYLLFLIHNTEMEGGRENKQTTGCLAGEEGLTRLMHRPSPLPAFWISQYFSLLSRRACPALMRGDGAQWPGPEISRRSELWPGGLQRTRIALPSGWPLGIA